MWGHNTFLLPYIEEQATFDLIDFNFAPTHANNFNVRSRVIQAFMCPSDPAVTLPLTPGRYWGTGANATQYGSVVGNNGTPAFGTDPGTAGTNGYVGSMCNYWGSGGDNYQSDSSATSGCSNTGTPYATFGCGGGADGPGQAAGNYSGGPGLRTAIHRGIFTNAMLNNAGYVSDASALPNVPAQTIVTVTDGTAKTILFGHKASGDLTWNGLAWYSGFQAGTTNVQQNHAHACADTGQGHGSCANGSSTNVCCNSTSKRQGFSGYHGNTWAVAMVDGSVTWLTRSIDQKVYNALGSKNGENTRNFAGTTSYAPEASTSGVD